MAASKVVLQCCLYNRSVHQHPGNRPLSRPALGDACVLEASHVACNHDAMSSQRKVLAGGVRWQPRQWCCSAVSQNLVLYISTWAMDH